MIQNSWPKNIKHLTDDLKIFHQYRNELSVKDGLIFKGDQILILYSLRRTMIDRVHVSHNGIEVTLNLAKSNIFWPGMTSEIKNKLRNCQICAKYQSSQQKTQMISHNIPLFPFQYISMDVFMTDFRGKTTKFLIIVDHYSDYFEVDILKDLTPSTLIDCCKINFARHGIPARVCTDNGTNFISQEFKTFCLKWDIEHVSSSPHHQQGNGKAEAAVKIAKTLIKKAQDSHEDFWYSLLYFRNVTNKMGSTPVQRLFSRNTRCGIPTTVEKLKPKIIDDVPKSIEKQKMKTKEVYDRHSKKSTELTIGQPVFVQLNPGQTKIWTKGVIQKRLSETSYVIKANGAECRRSSIHIRPFGNEDSSINNNGREQTKLTESQTQELPVGNEMTNENHYFDKSTETRTTPDLDTQFNKPIKTRYSEDTNRKSENFADDPKIRPTRNKGLPERFKDYVMQ